MSVIKGTATGMDAVYRLFDRYDEQIPEGYRKIASTGNVKLQDVDLQQVRHQPDKSDWYWVEKIAIIKGKKRIGRRVVVAYYVGLAMTLWGETDHFILFCPPGKFTQGMNDKKSSVITDPKTLIELMNEEGEDYELPETDVETGVKAEDFFKG